MNDQPQPPENENETGEQEKTKASGFGKIDWVDLTVADAPGIRNFYKAVVGWNSEDVDMGNYADYNMKMPETNDTIAGICHARGSNANLPGQWLIYVRVSSVQESVAECEKRGGKVLDGPRRMAGMNFCVIEDPAGAALALMSEG